MSKKKAFGFVFVGFVSFVCGAVGAKVFYRFPMGFFDLTLWWDVAIFSAIALAGIALVFYATLLFRSSS
jgi:hypothetical protein